MEKKERKILIIGIIIATILLIVLIIFGIIYYQNIINNKIMNINVRLCYITINNYKYLLFIKYKILLFF